MSGRICVAMCITIVPSAWNADAIAIRSRPERLQRPGQDLARVRLLEPDVQRRRVRRLGGGSARGRPSGRWRAEPGGLARGVYPSEPFRMLRRPVPRTKGRQPHHVRHRPDRSARRHPRQPARERRGGRRPPRRGRQPSQARGLRPRARRPGDARRRRPVAPHRVPGRGRLPLGPGLDAPDERPAVVDPGHPVGRRRRRAPPGRRRRPWRSPPARAASRSRSCAISEIYTRDKAKEAVVGLPHGRPGAPRRRRGQRRRRQVRRRRAPGDRAARRTTTSCRTG